MANFSKSTSLIVVTLAYLLSLAAGIGTGFLVQDQPQWMIILLADVAATLVIYVASIILRNTSLYDPYWSVIPIWIVAYLLVCPTGEPNGLRQWLAGGLVTLWGLRLTWNWIRGWSGMDHEDWRYVLQRQQTGKLFEFVNFFGLQMMPTALVYLGCIPLIAAMSESNTPFGWLDMVACIVTLAAILIEAIADLQLRNFRKANTDPKNILATGLWKYSRHPNYFGELSFWYGVALFGISAAPDAKWQGAGALAMTALFLFISIPMIDKRMVEKRPHYRERMSKVSALFPWPPKK